MAGHVKAEEAQPEEGRETGSAGAAQLREHIDRGGTGDKVAFSDPAAAPLGTDAEAGGAAPTRAEVDMAARAEANRAPEAEVKRDPGDMQGASAGPGPGLAVVGVIVLILLVLGLFLLAL